MAYEYYLKFWGGASETIKNELGIEVRDHWFDSKEEREEFVSKLMVYNHLGLALDREEGEHTRIRTIAKIKATFEGKEYEFEEDFGFAYPPKSAIFMFTDGNYSCDCNLSIFLRDNYPDFPELDCGEEIDIISLVIVQV